MKNGSILLQHGKDTKGIYGIASKLIKFFTGSWISHVTIYLSGNTYESTIYRKDDKWHGGIVITPGVGGYNHGYLEPTFDLTDQQITTMIKRAEEMKEENHPYNLLRFVLFPILLVTRWFWRAIKWIPFNRELHGEVCSTFVDELYKEAGIDLFDNELEQYTVPVDFLKLTKGENPKFIKK